MLLLKRGRWVHQRQAECFSLEESFQLTIFCNTTGNRVFNQKTGHIGKVIGYGHQMLKVGYISTLKVLVVKGQIPEKAVFVEEDLYSAWRQWSKSDSFQLLLKQGE